MSASTVLTFAVPLLVGIALATYAAYYVSRAIAAERTRWIGARPSHRGMLAEVRAEREKTGTPGSFEAAA